MASGIESDYKPGSRRVIPGLVTLVFYKILPFSVDADVRKSLENYLVSTLCCFEIRAPLFRRVEAGGKEILPLREIIKT